jgi:hypothetical protein
MKHPNPHGRNHLSEEVWEREGLFISVDELCKLKGGGCILNDPFLTLRKDYATFTLPLFTKVFYVMFSWS